MLCGALVAGLVGMLIERLVVRHLYDRPLDTIVATWGISLIATQGALILLGSDMPGVGTPLGSFTFGGYSYSTYRLVLMAARSWCWSGSTCSSTRPGSACLPAPQSRCRTWREALGVDTRRIYA